MLHPRRGNPVGKKSRNGANSFLYAFLRESTSRPLHSGAKNETSSSDDLDGYRRI